MKTVIRGAAEKGGTGFVQGTACSRTRMTDTRLKKRDHELDVLRQRGGE